MKERVLFGLALGLLTLGLWSAPPTARAQQQSCLYEGRTYPEMTTMCQGGLLQTCINGEWQNNGGERCGEDDEE